MKAIIIILLFGITISYDAKAATNYARRYCSSYNIRYYNWSEKGEDAFFVSQCLVAGGQDLKGCPGRDNYGLIPSVSGLKRCLILKGWKSSSSKPVNFKEGYPIFAKSYNHAMIATGFNGDNIIYCAHRNDRCDAVLNSKSVEYYYI